MKKLKFIPFALSIPAALVAGVSSAVVLGTNVKKSSSQKVTSVQSLKSLYEKQDQSFQKALESDVYYKDLVGKIDSYDGKTPRDYLGSQAVNSATYEKEIIQKNLSWTKSYWGSQSTQRGQFFRYVDPAGISFFLMEKNKNGEWNSIKQFDFGTSFENGTDGTVSEKGMKWDIDLFLSPDKIFSGSYKIMYKLNILVITIKHKPLPLFEAVGSSDFANLFKSEVVSKNVKSAKLKSLTFDFAFSIYERMLNDMGNPGPDYGKMDFNGYSIESDSQISYTDPSKFSNFSIDRLYINPIQIKNDNAGKSTFVFPTLNSYDWQKYLKIYDSQNNLLDPSKIKYSDFLVDDKNLLLKFKASIKNNVTKVYEDANITIPLHVVYLDNLVRVSRESDTFLEHPTNNASKAREWTRKPTTRLIINEEYLNVLRSVFYKEELVNRFNQVAWLFSDEAKQIINEKINEYKINIDNFTLLLKEYIDKKDISVLKDLTLDSKINSWMNDYKFNLLTKEDILYVFKNLDLSFDYGISPFSTKQISFVDFNANATVQIPSVDNIYRTYWEMIIKNVRAVSKVSNIISNTTLSIYRGFSEEDLKNFFDLEIRFVDIDHKVLIHAYKYNANN